MFSEHQDNKLNFGENRLIFRQKRPTKAPHTKGEKPKSGTEIREGLDDLLREIQDPDLFEPRESDKPGPTTQTDTQYHSRRAFKPKPYYEASVKIAERAVALDFRREAKETLLIQGVHDNLYKQYMNPAFMMHLQAQPNDLLGKVYSALDLIMKYPDDFEYISKPGGIIEIVKKSGEGHAAAIKDDFLVVMEGAEGSISRVRHDVEHGGPDEDLKLDGEIPWLSNDEFNSKTVLYNQLFKNTLSRYLMAGGFEEWYIEKVLKTRAGVDTSYMNEAYKKMYLKAIEEMGVDEKEIKEIYVTMNITIPQRFVKLIEMRGLTWEQEDKRIQDIVREQKLQGETYEDITQHGYGKNGKLRIKVSADPNLPGVYLIYTRKYSKHPLRVNMLGQIMRQDEEGNWKPDPRYTDNVRRDYYYRGETNSKPNKDLLEKDEDLSEEDKTRMEDAEEATKKDSEINKRVAKMYELIERRQTVDQALFKEKDINKLRELSLYMMPTHKKKSKKAVDFVNNMSDKKWLRKSIKRTLDTEDVPKLIHTRNDHVAAVLGVTLPPRKK